MQSINWGFFNPPKVSRTRLFGGIALAVASVVCVTLAALVAKGVILPQAMAVAHAPKTIMAVFLALLACTNAVVAISVLSPHNEISITGTHPDTWE